MMILNMYASTIGNNNEGRVELSDLVEQEVADYKSYEIALMVFYIFFVLEDLFEFLVEYRHSDGKYVCVLIKILVCFIIFMLV